MLLDVVSDAGQGIHWDEYKDGWGKVKTVSFSPLGFWLLVTIWNLQSPAVSVSGAVKASGFIPRGCVSKVIEVL